MALNYKAATTAFKIDKSEDGVATISGYASTFGNADFVNDVVVKGAYAQTIKEWKKKNKTPPILYQHDSRCPIGKITKMAEDDNGLLIEAIILKSIEKGEEAAALIEAGILDSMSIGYTIKDYEYDMKKNVRYLKQINLGEVSVVTFPCNDQAAITGIKGLPITIREFEEFLRDAGYSQKQAKAIASGGFKAIDNQRDVEDDAMIKLLDNFTTKLKG